MINFSVGNIFVKNFFQKERALSTIDGKELTNFRLVCKDWNNKIQKYFESNSHGSQVFAAKILSVKVLNYYESELEEFTSTIGNEEMSQEELNILKSHFSDVINKLKKSINNKLCSEFNFSQMVSLCKLYSSPKVFSNFYKLRSEIDDHGNEIDYAKTLSKELPLQSTISLIFDPIYINQQEESMLVAEEVIESLFECNKVSMELLFRVVRKFTDQELQQMRSFCEAFTSHIKMMGEFLELIATKAMELEKTNLF